MLRSSAKPDPGFSGTSNAAASGRLLLFGDAWAGQPRNGLNSIGEQAITAETTAARWIIGAEIVVVERSRIVEMHEPNRASYRSEICNGETAK
jgi:hypothetical protein